MSSSNSKIVSHGTIYLIGNIMRRMVSFIMLPIYTQYLTTENYGTLELFSMVLDFAAIVFGLRIGEAVFRFYYQYEDERSRNEVISTTLWLVGALNALAVVILLVGAGPISAAVLGSAEFARPLALFSITLVFQSLTETVLTYIRVRQKPWLFVGFSTLKLAVQLSLNIYFVVVQRMAIDGVVWSALISNVVITLPLLWWAFSQTGFAFVTARAREITRFSIPMVLTSIISFYISFGDRYFLRVFGGGLDEVGVYSLGCRFGLLLGFLIGDPFSGIWNSERYLIVKQENARARFQSIFMLLNAAMVVVGVGIAIFVHDILRIMATPEFWSAYLIVPIVMAASMFQAWTSFTNLGVLLEGKTREIAIGTAVAAVASTIAYLLLIPALGVVGAAIGAATGHLGRLLWVTVRSEKLYAMQLPWGRAVGMLALGGVAFAVSLLKPDPLVLSLLTCTVIFVAFTAVLVLVPGFLPAEMRHTVLQALRDPRAALRRDGGTVASREHAVTPVVAGKA